MFLRSQHLVHCLEYRSSINVYYIDLTLFELRYSVNDGGGNRGEVHIKSFHLAMVVINM